MASGKVLLVSGGERAAGKLSPLVRDCLLEIQDQAVSGAEARRLLQGRDYDIILVNTPLTDEYGHELASYAAQETQAGVLLLARGEQFETAWARLESAGVFVVEKPLNPVLFQQALRMALACRTRLAALVRENRRLQKKVEEIRLVAQAKYALMQLQGMTEAQAHRYIEKRAMDLRVTRRSVAQDILKSYETV